MESFRTVMLAALLALLFVATATADENVLKLTSTTYDEAVNDGKVYFVKYFAPWCGHCKSLAPTWDKLAGELNGADSDVVIAHVDCTEDAEVCQREEVSGYPTLYVVYNGERKSEYSGGRDQASLKTYITNYAKTLKSS